MEKDIQNTTLWTEEEMDRLINYWNAYGKSSGEIGVLLGKTPKAVVSKIKRLRRHGVELIHQTRWGVREKQPSSEEYRKCLKCQERFLSKHCFNKICQNCTLRNANVYEASIMRILK